MPTRETSQERTHAKRDQRSRQRARIRRLLSEAARDRETLAEFVEAIGGKVDRSVSGDWKVLPGSEAGA